MAKFAELWVTVPMKDEFDRLEIVSPPSRVGLEGYYKLMGRGYPLEDESEDESMGGRLGRRLG
jgi:hypothetical protein